MMFHHVFVYYLVDLSTYIPTLRMVYYIWFSHIFNMYQMVSSLKFQDPAFQQPINKRFFRYNIMIKLFFSSQETIAWWPALLETIAC